MAMLRTPINWRTRRFQRVRSSLLISDDRRAITEAIKGAYDDNYGMDSCASCDKIYDRD